MLIKHLIEGRLVHKLTEGDTLLGNHAHGKRLQVMLVIFFQIRHSN
jgi:hypothetical protein